MGVVPQTEGSPVPFHSGWARAWVAVPSRGWGSVGEETDGCFSLALMFFSLFSSLPLSLKINKHYLKNIFPLNVWFVYFITLILLEFMCIFYIFNSSGTFEYGMALFLLVMIIKSTKPRSFIKQIIPLSLACLPPLLYIRLHTSRFYPRLLNYLSDYSSKLQ